MHLPALALVCLAAAAVAVDVDVDENQVRYDYEDEQYVDNKDKRDILVIADDVYDDKPAKVRFEEVMCSKVMNEMEKVMSESLCSNLVDVYVNTSEDSRYSYAPTRVKVKRCGGMCASLQACMPTDKKFVKRAVERMMLSNHVKDCAYAIVEEHTGCMCGCVIKAHHCKGKQTYNENACECECEDMRNKKGACLHKGHSWRGESCECHCPEGDEPCAPGHKWDTGECKCMKKRKPYYKKAPSWVNHP